ncbi:MAG: hypothetical protein GWN71_28645 [Gammaproteobacteria bacterium]|nr:hypothetical protein [Gemmatimonadota bacterium]NIU77376.1 hypothetical protein [Gammaproteobacteria bacterium]
MSTGEGSRDIRLTVDPESPSAGDPVVLVLTNHSNGPVGYNLCTSELERRADGAWRPVPSDRMCTMELRMLEPGAEARFDLALDPGMASGEYRYSTRIEVAGEASTVVSDAFNVG